MILLEAGMYIVYLEQDGRMYCKFQTLFTTTASLIQNAYIVTLIDVIIAQF